MRHCTYCPQAGADCCIRVHESVSGGSSTSVYAHRSCAEARRVTVLYSIVPAGQPS